MEVISMQQCFCRKSRFGIRRCKTITVADEGREGGGCKGGRVAMERKDPLRVRRAKFSASEVVEKFRGKPGN